MNGNKGTKILSEIYSKCLNQAKDVESEISKIINNKYPVNTIDRIKEKILEKLDNFSTSITNLLISINTAAISLNEKEIWKRKQENLLISLTNQLNPNASLNYFLETMPEDLACGVNLLLSQF